MAYSICLIHMNYVLNIHKIKARERRDDIVQILYSKAAYHVTRSCQLLMC